MTIILFMLSLCCFRQLEDRMVNVGILNENETIIARRKYVCGELKRMKEEGYYIASLDES